MDTRIQAVLNSVIAQRNQAMNVIADMEGEIAVLREQIAELQPKEVEKKD